MAQLQNTDLLLVNRDDTTYQLTFQELQLSINEKLGEGLTLSGNPLPTFADNDLFLVNRFDARYTVTYKELKDSVILGLAPVLTNVNLVENNAGVLPRFTNRQFTASTYLEQDGVPQSEKTFDAFVQGSIRGDIETSVITDSTNDVLTFADNTNSNNLVVGETLQQDSAGTPVTSVITNAANTTLTNNFEGTIEAIGPIDYDDQFIIGTPASMFDGDENTYWGLSTARSTRSFIKFDMTTMPACRGMRILCFYDDPDGGAGRIDFASSTPAKASQNLELGEIFNGGTKTKTWVNFTGSTWTGKATPAEEDELRLFYIDFRQNLGDQGGGGLGIYAMEYYPIGGSGFVPLIDGTFNTSILTLTDNTNLANLRVDDLTISSPAGATGKITSITENPNVIELKETAGTWVNGYSVQGPLIQPASGVVASVSGTEVQLTGSNERWLVTENNYETNKKLNKKAVQLNVPVNESKKYLEFNSGGNVTGLLDTPQSPAYVTTDINPGLTFTFPATFPSGLTPDEELGEGTTLTVQATASNEIGTSGPLSSTVQPALDRIQFDEPLVNVLDGAWYGASAAAAINWNAVTYGNGKFVAVCNNLNADKQVMYSPDGISWTGADSAKDISWRSVTYGELSDGTKRFVAIANDGKDKNNNQQPRVMYSTDGIDWTSANAASASQWYDVAYGNDRFVAVSSGGDPNRAMTSATGISWQGRQLPGSGGSWTGVGYGNGTWIAVGSAGKVARSSDGGVNWTAITTPFTTTDWGKVAYGNNTWVAIGTGDPVVRAMYSTDEGLTWIAGAIPAPNIWQYLTFGNGTFVAVASNGTNRVMYSSDGITWSGALAAEANSWETVTYGDGKFVAVANSGTNRVMWSYLGTGAEVLDFADGTDMTTIAPGDIVNQGATSGTVGAVIENMIALSSTDTGTWTPASSGGSNVIGPDKTPYRSLTAEELETQKLRFLTYSNRKMVNCGQEAQAKRDSLRTALVDAGYTIPEITSVYGDIPTPVAVNGYYPLYTDQVDANNAGNGSSHSHIFDGVTYYMPNGGVTIYHGNYTGY